MMWADDKSSETSRRKFMGSVAALGAGLYVGGAQLLRSETCSGTATGPVVTTKSCGAVRTIHDIVHSFSSSTTKMAGSVGQVQDGGEAQWTLDATYSGTEATKYHYTTVEEKFDGTWRIYFKDFNFNLSGSGTTKVKGLIVTMKGRAFRPNGTHRAPLGDTSIRVAKDVTDTSVDGSLGAAYQNYYDVVNNRSWNTDWSLQPMHVGKELWIGDNDASGQDRNDFKSNHPCSWAWQQQYGSHILRLTVDDLNDSDFGVVVYCNAATDEHTFEIYDCPSITALV